jgi:lambda family phage portal protein
LAEVATNGSRMQGLLAGEFAPPTNFIDRFITILSPQRGLARLQARTRLLMSGGYTGARSDRTALKDFTPRAGSPDSDIIGDLPTLRARSRDLCRNNPLSAGAVNTVVTSVVGSGIHPQARPDAELLGLSEQEAADWQTQAERVWWAHAGTAAIDLSRTLSIAGLQELALRSQLESGDVFVLKRFKPRPGDLFGLHVQLIEADRVSTPDGMTSDPTIRDGIETDEDGVPVRYWVAQQHPGDFYRSRIGLRKWSGVRVFSPTTGERLALHLFPMLRPGQVRGVPYLAPVIEPIKQLGRYTDAELMAAVLGAMFTVFVKTPGAQGLGAIEGLPIAQKDQAAAQGEIHMGSGLIVDLQPGEDITIADPTRPNERFDPFVLAVLRQIGVALQIPFELLIKHFTASYSAARAALLEAWKFFRTQREWLVRELCEPIYAWQVSEAIARGYLNAPGFFANPLIRRAWLDAAWIGPSPGQIDELKEMKATQLRIDTGVSTLQEETARITGGDWEANHRQRAKEVRMRREAGLGAGSAAAPGAAEGADQEDGEDEDEGEDAA